MGLAGILVLPAHADRPVKEATRVDPELTPADLEALRALDTPTVCNAIEILAPHRTGFGFTTRPLLCVHPHLAPMVGYVRTATIKATHPSGRKAEEELQTNLAYFRHMTEALLPTIAVIEDLDPFPGHGAWWGEVYTNVHKGLGLLGVVTNGSVRDLENCAAGFQILAGSIGPSHAHTHCVDFAIPVTVAGMRVRPGDLLHGDRHGAVIVPMAIARALPEVAARLSKDEAVWVAASQRPDFGYEIVERLLKGIYRETEVKQKLP
jgi:regulator of RNase E activity RraA